MVATCDEWWMASIGSVLQTWATGGMREWQIANSEQ